MPFCFPLLAFLSLLNKQKRSTQICHHLFQYLCLYNRLYIGKSCCIKLTELQLKKNDALRNGEQIHLQIDALDMKSFNLSTILYQPLQVWLGTRLLK